MRKPIRRLYLYGREMDCEEEGNPLPNGKPQESAGNLAACGKGRLAPPAEQ